MNTAKRTLVSAALFAAAIALCSSLRANTLDGGPTGTQGAPHILRTEPVDQLFRPTTGSVNVLQRVVYAGINGQYLAQVTTPDGTVLMEGMYNDPECLVPNGPFTYYHANGRVSARGCFAMGIKTGVWQRFDAHGNALAERVYNGLSWEQTRVQLEEASMDATRR